MSNAQIAYNTLLSAPITFLDTYHMVIHDMTSPTKKEKDNSHKSVLAISKDPGITKSSKKNLRDAHFLVGCSDDDYKELYKNKFGPDYMTFNSHWIDYDVVSASSNKAPSVSTIPIKGSLASVVLTPQLDNDYHRIAVGSQVKGGGCAIMRTAQWSTSSPMDSDAWAKKEKAADFKWHRKTTGQEGGNTTIGKDMTVNVVGVLGEDKWSFYIQKKNFGNVIYVDKLGFN